VAHGSIPGPKPIDAVKLALREDLTIVERRVELRGCTFESCQGYSWVVAKVLKEDPIFKLKTTAAITSCWML